MPENAQPNEPPLNLDALAQSAAEDAELRARLQELVAGLQAGKLPNATADSGAATFGQDDLTTAANPVPTAPGSLIGGRYKLLQLIGEGGMGTVWMAEQREPVRRTVAIKLVKPGMDSRAVVTRFEAERQALAVMDHPSIAKVLDGGTTAQGRPYFVMELVKGVPLVDYCDDRRLPIKARLDLFIQICAAVQHAHQKGIIHRDLKPSNVLVTEHDGQPVPKVIDFGLAKAMQGSQSLTEKTLFTAYGTVAGTPLYMAPEQVGINAFDVDTRTDVYALGVLLYELLTGTTPLERQRIQEAAWEEIQRVIREEEPPRPSLRLSSSAALPSIAAQRGAEPAALSQQVRGDLDWIVMKALEKDRGRRYETANGFSRDVQRYLANEPVEACPPSLAYLGRKFFRRHRGPVLVGATLLTAILLGTIGTTWMMVRALSAEAKISKSLDEVKQEQTKTKAALTAETTAKNTAALAEKSALRQAANSTLDKALSLCESGDIQSGLLWMADALDSAERGEDSKLSDACRYNLAYWSARTPTLEMSTGLDNVNGIALHPKEQRVAACETTTVTIYDLKTGEQVGPQLHHPADLTRVNCCIFSPDGETIYTGGGDGYVRFWDVGLGKLARPAIYQGGEEKRLSVTPSRRGVRSLSLNRAGNLLATGADDKVVFWDVTTGEKVGEPIQRGGQVTTVCFEGRGDFIWIGSENNSLQCFEVATRKPVCDECKYGYPICLASWPDKTGVVVGFRYGHGAALVNRQGIASPILPNPNDVQGVAVHPNGKWACAVDQWQFARIWDVKSGKTIGGDFRAFGVARATQFLPDGSGVVIGTSGRRRSNPERPTRGSVQRWRVPTESPVRMFQARHPVVVQPDGTRIASFNNGGSWGFWDRASGAEIKTEAPPTPTGGFVYELAFDNQQRLLAATRGGNFYRWNPFTKTDRLEVSSQKGSLQFVFSADGKRVVIRGDTLNTQVWDLEQQKSLFEVTFTDSGKGAATTSALSHDGTRLAIGNSAGTVGVWEIATKKPLTPLLEQSGEITGLGFSADGESLLIGLSDGTARWQRISDGATLGGAMVHGSPVRSVRFSLDEQLIFSGSTRQGARIWHAATGRPVGPRLVPDRQIQFIDPLPGNLLFTSGQNFNAAPGKDGEAYVWQMPSPWKGNSSEVRNRVEAATGLRIMEDRSIGLLLQMEVLGRLRRR